MDYFKGHLGVKESFIAGLMKHNISAFHKQHISIFKYVEVVFLNIFKTLHYFCWDRFLNLSGFMDSFNFSTTLLGFTICQTQAIWCQQTLCKKAVLWLSHHPGTQETWVQLLTLPTDFILDFSQGQNLKGILAVCLFCFFFFKVPK